MVVEKLEKAVGCHDFLEAVKKVAKGRGLEIKDKGDSLIKDVRENQSEYRLREENWNIFHNKEIIYRIKQKCEDKHERGQGGYCLYEACLFKTDNQKEKLLEAKNYLSWDSYSDDSEDFLKVKEQYVILCSDNKFAEEVFEEIKRK